MSKENITKDSNYIHPEKPGAVGSRNSTYRAERDEYDESAQIVDEEVDKILNHIQSKLPPEVLEKLDIMGGVKEKLHNYYNQNLQNMLGRYLVTVEDELSKKYRDFLDQEEKNQINRYTPRAITELMSKIGGEERFNTSEFEKSIANIYGHMQGHVQRSIHNLEHETNALLRQKNDVGAFLRQDNAYAIVKCSFKNNPIKPRTVFDVKLAINILDNELITPIYHYQKPIQDLLKEMISEHIHQQIDKEIKELNQFSTNEGKDSLDQDKRLFQKLNALEKHLAFDDNPNETDSKRYEFVAKRILDSLDTEKLDSSEEHDVLSLRENVKAILDKEHSQNRGFNSVVNTLTSILDDSRMGYQFIDNLKNGRICIIREYANTNQMELPDEVFGVRLSYFDMEQLIEMRKAYDLQAEELAAEIKKAVMVVSKVYDEFREENNIKNYRDVSREILGEESMENEYGDLDDKLWNDLLFVSLNEEKSSYKTNQHYTVQLKRQLLEMKKKVEEIFADQHPQRRLIIEERLDFLERSFQTFASQINPHHLQQGLVLEVDITSVKRKRTTINAMSNVLNEFLHRVSKGGQRDSVTDFAKRRSILSDREGQTGPAIFQKVGETLEKVGV